MKALTLKSFGLQADASRPSTQVCVEIFDKGDGERHAGRAMALIELPGLRGPATLDRSGLIV
jgi:hypothetical protein